MGCGNQSFLTALEEGKDERCLTNKPSGADGGDRTHGAYSFDEGIMSLPFLSLDYDHFPGRDMQGDCSYTPDMNFLLDPKVDKTLSNIKSGMSEFHSEFEIPPPNLSLRGHGADQLIIPAVTSMDYGKSEIPMNFTPPRCETGTGYPMKTRGVEAQNSRSSRFQMSGQFSSSRSSTSLLPLVDNFGATGNEADTNHIPHSSSSPQIIDRNFLTLGIGGGIGVRRNSNFSTQEISNKLEEVSSECENPTIGYCPKNPSSFVRLAGGDARIQTNAGGLSRPGSNFSAQKIPSAEVSSQINNSNSGNCLKNPLSLTQLSGRDARIQTNADGLSISNRNFSSKLKEDSFQRHTSFVGHYPKNPSNLTQFEGGAAVIQADTGGISRPAGHLASSMRTRVGASLSADKGFKPSSIPFPGVQTLQANIPSNTPSKCYASVSEPTPLILPSGSTLFSQPKCGLQPEIMSTYSASQPISLQQDYSRKSPVKVLSESYRNHVFHMHKQSSIGLVQPGNLSSEAESMRTKVAKNGSFPSSVQSVGQFDVHNVSPIEAHGNYISSERIGVQVSKSSTCQSAATSHFPKRLGLQSTDFATAPSVRGPFPSPIHLAAYLNQFRPMVPTGVGQYQHGMPAQSSSLYGGVNNSNGQVVSVAKLGVRPQAAPIISRPPLKRKAVANPSAPSGQRRKLLPQPVINDSTSQLRQSIPVSIPAAAHIPPTPLHVKWEGCDEPPPEPSGQRCLLCKRDLSFTAEGVMYQPTAPPPVAVLPCGHTFHDHCLEIITPADQLKCPPCIPCAIGET